MPEIRFLIPETDAQAMWNAKDRFRKQRFLAQDPLNMHRSLFDRWIKLAASAALEEAATHGIEEDVAVDIIVSRLARIQDAWKAEAKRRHRAANGSEEHVYLESTNE
jgi:hypothetical protein